MILFRVGQHIKTFSLCTKTEEVDERGRVTYTAEEPTVQINKEIFFILRMKNRSYFLYSCFSCVCCANCCVKALINIKGIH